MFSVHVFTKLGILLFGSSVPVLVTMCSTGLRVVFLHRVLVLDDDLQYTAPVHFHGYFKYTTTMQHGIKTSSTNNANMEAVPLLLCGIDSGGDGASNGARCSGNGRGGGGRGESARDDSDSDNSVSFVHVAFNFLL